VRFEFDGGDSMQRILSWGPKLMPFGDLRQWRERLHPHGLCSSPESVIGTPLTSSMTK
jgi:hypothetical protein